MISHDDAKTIARVVGTADGGCPSCVRDLCAELNLAGLGWRFSPTGVSETEERVDPRDGEFVTYVERVVVNVEIAPVDTAAAR